MELIGNAPCWYWPTAFAWAAYQGVRGARELRISSKAGSEWGEFDRWFILYVHDFVFRAVCTLAGFVAALACYGLATELRIPDMTPGQAALFIGLSLVTVAGVGGQLHNVILLGKIPFK
jgi:hypothetical protein